MTWHLSHGAYSFQQYRVIPQGRRWSARKTRSHSFPQHLGVYDTPEQAMAACIADCRGVVTEEAE